MGLFDKLMAVDDSKITERKKESFSSERLKELLGIDTPITIEALPYRQVKGIIDSAMKDNGRMDPDREVDSTCHIIRLSVKDIPWGNEELQKKFRASDPKDLVEKLFDYEIGRISDRIIELSGFGEDSAKKEAEDEEKIKNL